MRRNSPHPSSSTGTSRSPTPSPSPNSKLNRKKFFHPIDAFLYEISNDRIWFPIIIILSIILSVITLNMTPTFCSATGSHTSFRCKKCPDNSKCGAISFKCEEGYYKINNKCVTQEQRDLYTSEIEILTNKISEKLSEFDKNETVLNLDQLSSILDESPYPIRTAIEYTDYRIGANDIIEKDFESPSICGYWIYTIISYIFTLFGLIVLAYHFLRYKSI